MRLARHANAAGVSESGCALTIGNFDAVHLGHQRILATLRRRADERGVPAVVMTFDPHPQEYFRGVDCAPRLSTLSTRYFALREHGVDVMLCLRFDGRLAGTTAEEFVRDVLGEQLAVRHLLIGDDFCFGKDRGGDFELLSRMAGPTGYTLERTDTLSRDGERVSSTRVRNALDAGDLAGAAALLGRPYALAGRVVHGQRLGRQWGFPTLNLAVRHKPALTGVFAVRVAGLDETELPGVANLGTRPTVDGLRTLLEVHLFDFAREVYGRRICVSFIEKIRAERKFPDFDALKAQILRDSERARELLGV